MYLGKKGHFDDDNSMDSHAGPQAVVRNLRRYFKNTKQPKRRLVAIDRYYTSIQLSQQLRRMGFNSVGTISRNRLGLTDKVIWPFKTRPKKVARGTVKMCQSKSNSDMVAIGWVDNRPVYFVANGVDTLSTVVRRREKKTKQRPSTRMPYPCPGAVRYTLFLFFVWDLRDFMRDE